MSNDKQTPTPEQMKAIGLSDFDPGAVMASPVKAAQSGKPLSRLTLTVEFFHPVDHAGIAELIDAVKLYGTVQKASHQVLRAHKQELI